MQKTCFVEIKPFPRKKTCFVEIKPFPHKKTQSYIPPMVVLPSLSLASRYLKRLRAFPPFPIGHTALTPTVEGCSRCKPCSRCQMACHAVTERSTAELLSQWLRDYTASPKNQDNRANKKRKKVALPQACGHPRHTLIETVSARSLSHIELQPWIHPNSHLLWSKFIMGVKNRSE